MENDSNIILNPKTLISTVTEFFVTGQGLLLKIRFNPDEDNVPEITDKRTGFDFEQLRFQAEREKIAIIEDAALTRWLFELTESGDEIPSETFAVIVKVIAFLRRLEERKYQTGPNE